MSTTLTTAQCLALLNTTDRLAGAPRVIGMNGKTPQVVVEPYDFTDKVTWNLARNRRTLREVAELAAEEKAKFANLFAAFKNGLNKDADPKTNAAKLEEKDTELTTRYEEFLKQPNEIKLLTIPWAGLNAKVNKIPHTIVEELMAVGLLEGEPEFDGAPKKEGL